MLDWNQLSVVTTEGSVPHAVGWQPSPQIFGAETCMRHIYVGLRDDFGEAARALVGHKKTTYYTGAAAYRFFLEFYAGLHSRHASEQDTARQSREAWNNHARLRPDAHKELKPYIDALFHDGRLVVSAILHRNRRRATLVNTAVTMAALNPDKRALVVGGAFTLSQEMIRGLGHRKPNQPGTVVLTHPDARETNKIMAKIRALQGYKSLSARIETVPFADALKDGPGVNMYNADAVFVCLPMTEDRSSRLGIQNRELHDAWHLRHLLDPDHDARLLHIKGDPYKRETTSGVWTDTAHLQGFMAREDLDEHHRTRVRFIKEVVAKAHESIAHLSRVREHGDWIKKIEFDPRQMQLGYVEGRRQLGFRPPVAGLAPELRPAS